MPDEENKAEETSRARDYRLVVRLFGALIVIIALFWLRPFYTENARLGKILIVLAAMVFSRVPRAPGKLWHIRRTREWRTWKDWLIIGIGAVLLLMGLQLTTPHHLAVGPAVSYWSGIFALAIGATLVMGRVQRRPEPPEDGGSEQASK